MSDTITGAEEIPTDTAALEAAETAAWDDFDKAEASVASEGADNGEGRDLDEGTGTDGTQTSDDETNASGSDDGASSPHATADTASEAASDKDSADGQASADQTKPDPWAKAPAEYRKLYEDEVTELRKRLAGQDRKIGQLNARLLASTSGTSASAPGKSGTGGSTAKDGATGTGAGTGSLDDDPDLKKLTEDFPEVADPIRKVLEASNANVRAVADQLAAMQAGEREAILADNEASVLGRHTDFVEVATSPEFRAWADGLSPSLKAILAENAKRIVDPQGAIAIVDLFKAQHVGTAGAAAGAAQAGDGKGTGSNLSGKRARQEESATSGPRGGGSRPMGGEPPPDAPEDELWDFYDKRDRKRAAS